jgi:hypothetical protein
VTEIFQALDKDAAIARRKKKLVLSASAISTFVDGCKRKWWFAKVAKLPSPHTPGHFTFGTVFHSVLERWLLADDRGYDENGEPVNLYPDGWHLKTEWDGRLREEITTGVSEQEQELIRVLVDKAIEGGVIARLPGRQIEHEFWMDLIDGVEIMGFIDEHTDDRVIDHKTIGNIRYRKGVKTLAKNLQLLVYAKVLLEDRRRRGMADPKVIWVQWNQFTKGKRSSAVEARSIDVGITPARIDEFWTEVIEPAAAEMLALRSEGDVQQVPKNLSECRAYGGCDFTPICAGVCSMAHYRKTTLKAVKNRLQSDRGEPVSEREENNPMPKQSFAEAMKARKAVMEAAKGGGAKPAPAPTPEPTPDPGPTTEQTQAAHAAEPDTAPSEAPKSLPAADYIANGEQSAPWAASACRPCDNNSQAVPEGRVFVRGVRSNGTPCPICQTKAKPQGLPMPSWFNIEGDETHISWLVKDEYLDRVPEALHGGNIELIAAAPEATASTKTDTEPVDEDPWKSLVESAEATLRDAGMADVTPGALVNSLVLQVGPGSVKLHGDQILARTSRFADAEDGLQVVIEQTAAGTIEQPATVSEHPPLNDGLDPEPEKAKGKKKKTGAGRPKASFTLCRGCIPIRGMRRTTLLADLLQEWGQNLAEARGEDSYWNLNAFQRRDFLREAAAELAAEIKGRIVLAHGRLGPDEQALYDALAPYASTEITAAAG